MPLRARAGDGLGSDVPGRAIASAEKPSRPHALIVARVGGYRETLRRLVIDGITGAAVTADGGARDGGNAVRQARSRAEAHQEMRPWQCLYLRPEPQGHGALRATLPQVVGSLGSRSSARAWRKVPCGASAASASPASAAAISS